MDTSLIEKLKLDTGFDYMEDEVKQSQSDRDTLDDLQISCEIGLSVDLSAVSELDGLIAKYPDRPEFLNHKAVLYLISNKRAKVHKIIEQLVRKFPGYVFGRLMHAERLLTEEKFDEFEAVLKHNLDAPFEGDELYYTTVSKYLLLLIKYYIAVDHGKKVDETFRKCLSLNDDFDTAEIASRMIFKDRIMKFPKALAADQEKIIEPESKIMSDFSNWKKPTLPMRQRKEVQKVLFVAQTSCPRRTRF